jgi:hypothetical protein
MFFHHRAGAALKPERVLDCFFFINQRQWSSYGNSCFGQQALKALLGHMDVPVLPRVERWPPLRTLNIGFGK